MRNDRRRCPQCGMVAPYEGNPFRPFCSKRCKMVDLGAWLREGYCISSPVAEGHEETANTERGSDDRSR